MGIFTSIIHPRYLQNLNKKGGSSCRNVRVVSSAFVHPEWGWEKKRKKLPTPFDNRTRTCIRCELRESLKRQGAQKIAYSLVKYENV